jgi:uncharacterized protein DUF4446
MATYIAVFAMVLAYVALVAAYLALRTLAKVRRSTAMLLRSGRVDGASDETITDELERQAEQYAALAEQSTVLSAQSRELADRLADLQAFVDAHTPTTPDDDEVGALRRVALVRYDAFADMSGRLSFSLALLDSSAGGVVVSAIAGRSDTRVYAKGIVAGKGEHELSPEEGQAVRSAMHEKRAGLLGRKAS